MKRKRGARKRKSKKPSTGGAAEVVVEPGYYSDRNEENDEFESRTDMETRAVHTKMSGQHVGLDNPENNETVSGALAKLARAISSSHVNPTCDRVSQQRERIGQKEPKSSHQEPVYNKQELDAAHSVIKKIMKMEAAAAFNAPVDPIALGIPDYFDIIDTPMDFGTICSKLESGLKYRNSEEVFKDVELIWDNCCKYNRKGSLILELMKRVKNNFKRQWIAAGLYKEQSTVTTGHLCHNPQPCQDAVHMDPVASTISSSAHLRQHDWTSLKQRQYQKLSTCGSHNFEPQEISYHCQCSLNSGQLQPGLHQHDLTPQQKTFVHLHPGDLMSGKSCSQRVSEASPSLLHSCQPSPCCSLMGRYNQRGCMHQSSLSQLPPYRIEAGTSSHTAGHLHLPHREPISTFTKCDAFNLGRDVEDRYQQQQCQMDSAHMQAYDPSASCMPVHHVNQSTCQQLLSSHAKGPRNSDCGGNLHIPPPTVSTGNCTKHTTECLLPPVTDNTGCRELNQINPIPEQSSSMINIIASHPVEKTCQNQPESSPSEHLHSTADNNFFKRITRGQTQMQCQEQSSSMMNSQKHQHQENTCKIPTISPESQPSPPTADHNRKISGGQEPTDVAAFGGERIPVPTNAQGQPVGPHAQKLVSFLGTLARNGHFLPLTYLDWRHVPSEKKKKMWEKVQLKFDIDPACKNWVLQSLGRRWKDWKSKLKTAHYYPHETDEERLADCDERILPDQWAALVKLWNTESAQKNSATNRANRMKAKYIHASGRKSFARIREEQRNRPDGKELSRAELFILTRTRRDGKPVNEASSEVIKKLQYQVNGQDTPRDSNKQADVLSQIIGPDKRGRTRCIELGPSYYTPDLGGPVPACSESTRMVSESEANAEIRDLKEKMAVMEQTCTQMVSQMAALVSMVSSMHKNTPDKNIPDTVANTSGASDHPATQAVDTRPTTHAASTRQTRRSKRNI
ncbi:Ankyrin repeat, bromo and BTB domain-containing protein DDB [Sesamum alatum]|uniref:Ankyrin repeat, bromo and BTB domain-containing protein DDB n=1 Tax=Sesamum alatum TaxID=300844 RepID=A0AAE1YZ02_9LAMI|nr:Ankyrin repeat, bromo and BTB domain-containing protein DDB [Sesamum alatum]